MERKNMLTHAQNVILKVIQNRQACIKEKQSFEDYTEHYDDYHDYIDGETYLDNAQG